ncbi:hypothetical protein [Massilia pseudoviolaceinigra]|uniref:hypothetical protein n=1 Tax=Massilia pseudoviolaceinigra TaxID=3057165 RepID=UPI0027965B70|nr:hypothetical protein [Massilia sp. CCM 9206]MDQ1922619.1 hypothetical protein [Massilia sp. CCM 9206]
MMKLLAGVLAVAASASAGAAAPTGPNIMQVDVRLTGDQYITSRNGLYRLVMQGNDGNLVLYAVGGGLMIPTGFRSKPGGSYAVVQYDGNFVVYKSNDTWHWTSRTGGRATAAYIMVLGEDGSLTVRNPENGDDRLFFRDEKVEIDSWGWVHKFRPEVPYPTRKGTGPACVDSIVLARTGALATTIANNRGETLGKCTDPPY